MYYVFSTSKPEDQEITAIGWMGFAHTSLTESHKNDTQVHMGKHLGQGSIKRTELIQRLHRAPHSFLGGEASQGLDVSL